MREIFKGSTSHSEYVVLVDSTTGLPKTGLVYTDITGSYARTRSARVAITMATLTVTGAYSSGGFVEIDATNQPGLYRFDIPDAAFATGADSVVVTMKATGTKTENKEFRLVGVDNQAATVPATLAASQPNYAPAIAGDMMTLTSAYDDAKTAAQAGDQMTLTSAYDDAKTAAQAGDSMTLTTGERDAVAAALLDLVDAIETGYTPRQALKLCLSALAGKVSVSGTTVTFRSADDSADRITATVDTSGNRSAVTLTP